MKRLFAKKSLELLLEEMSGEHRLRRVLGPVALTSLGIGTIIGSGIFVVTGIVAQKTGPAMIMSFVVAAVACVLAALCYAEFAAMAPVAGSAYTYAYTTLGELFAWIIGWDLIIEYTIASASIANAWSHYFQSLLAYFSLHLPDWMTRAPIHPASGLSQGLQWTGSYIDLPALVISLLLTIILVLGIRESARFNALIVMIKLAIVLLVIGVGAFFINPANWHPFAPFGWKGLSFFGEKTVWGMTDSAGKPLGMLAGAGMLFYAYIGFDSVSTHSEEARNPQRDVPIGIIASLIVCTVLYIAVAIVLTGMVPYTHISADAPIAHAFEQVGLQGGMTRLIVLVIIIGALAGITSVQLVLMLSQPRVLLAMARDGLLPAGFFGAVHPRFRTPWKSTILTGLLVGLISSLLPLQILAELVNIGTLLAFVIVCLAVMIMRYTNPQAQRPFRCPFVPLVPLLGTAFCLLLMFSLPSENWLRLVVWLAIGLVIYFFYGRHHSILARRRAEGKE